MKLLKVLIVFLPLSFISVTSVAQNENEQKASLNNGAIESQFEYLFQKSYKWTDPRTGQRFRTVKVNDLFKFRNNVYDSLKVGRENLLAEKKITAIQKSEIEALKLDLSKTNENLTSVTKEKDSIKFLGIPMSKAGYNSLLWTVIAALTAGLLFFITRFKRSNAITIQAKKDKQEIEQEYEEHRQRALEREQKLRRELQDELNKQKYAKQAATTKKRSSKNS